VPDTPAEFDCKAALAACATGDRRALHRLYEHEGRRLPGVALRIVRSKALAEDIVHDAWLNIWTRAASFDDHCGSARGWIDSVTRNLALNAVRDGAQHVEVDDTTSQTLEADLSMRAYQDMADAYELNADLGRLQPCLQALDQLAGEYVLGTLHAEQRREVQTHQALEPALREAVQRWEARLLPLTRLAPPESPSAQLWARIEASLNAKAQAQAQALAEPLATPRFMVLPVRPQDKAPGWMVQASSSRQVNLIPLAVTEVPADKVLQLWTKADGWSGPVSLGLVKPGQSIQIALDKLPPLQPKQLFELTLEPPNGSPLNKPTGPIQYIGPAVKTR
jgi:RNA polymerase sigma factor (sigma-70 family)